MVDLQRVDMIPIRIYLILKSLSLREISSELLQRLVVIT